MRSSIFLISLALSMLTAGCSSELPPPQASRFIRDVNYVTLRDYLRRNHVPVTSVSGHMSNQPSLASHTIVLMLGPHTPAEVPHKDRIMSLLEGFVCEHHQVRPLNSQGGQIRYVSDDSRGSIDVSVAPQSITIRVSESPRDK